MSVVDKKNILKIERAINMAGTIMQKVEQAMTAVTVIIDGLGALGIATLIEKCIASFIEWAIGIAIDPIDIACQAEFAARHKLTSMDMIKRAVTTEIHRCSKCRWIGHNTSNCPN